MLTTVSFRHQKLMHVPFMDVQGKQAKVEVYVNEASGSPLLVHKKHFQHVHLIQELDFLDQVGLITRRDIV